MCALEAHDFIFFGKRGKGVVRFSYLFWVNGACECFLFYFGSWVVFCVLTHFCFGLVCKVVSSSIFFTYKDDPHGDNTKTNIFLISLQRSCGGPKRVLLFSLAWVGHMVKRSILFLVWFTKWFWRSKLFLFFSLTWVQHMYRKLKKNLYF